MRGATRGLMAMRPAAAIVVVAAWFLVVGGPAAAAGSATATGSATAAARADSTANSPTGRAAVTKVGYVSGGSIYLDAGRDLGVTVGDSAEARRNGRRIAGLLIREVTSRRAVCDTFGVIAMPEVGDEVRYVARPAAGPGFPAATDTIVADAGVAPARPITSGRARRTWRGRVGAGYLYMNTEGGGSIRQPTLDLRLDRASRALDVHADVRGRSTTITSGTENQTRVYRLAATLHDDALRRRFTVGRQVLSSAPGAAFFDGAVMEMDRGRWTLGFFGGGAPEPGDYSPSLSELQAGGFTRVRSARGPNSWGATVGFLGSRYKGTADRNVVFVDASHTAPGRSLFLAQEIDFNPGWKQDLGDPSVSMTSTFVWARQALGRKLALDGGYDNRRSVRLAREQETLETAFDDRYRQGGYAGLNWEPTGWVRVGGSGRWSAGSPHAARSATGTLVVRRPKTYDLSLRLRSTHVDGSSTGWLHVAEGEWNWSQGGRVTLRGGVENWNDANGFTTTKNNWQGLDLEQSVGVRTFVFASGEHRDGDGGGSNQFQTGLSWFF